MSKVLPQVPRQAMVPLDVLRRHPKNYRQHPQSQIVRVAASLEEYGQRKPLPVRETPEGVYIVAGHCVLESLTLLAQKNITKFGHAWVTYVPDTWTDDKAVGYLIADNKTSEGAVDDYGFLAALVKQQQDTGADLAALGFTHAMYHDMVKAGENAGKGSEAGEPEVPFTAELLEEMNYVVLFFDNSVDWQQLLTLYPLPTVQALHSKPGFRKKGIGRVVNGPDFLKKVRGL